MPLEPFDRSFTRQRFGPMPSVISLRVNRWEPSTFSGTRQVPKRTQSGTAAKMRTLECTPQVKFGGISEGLCSEPGKVDHSSAQEGTHELRGPRLVGRGVAFAW
jgi:hypothetical protein